MKQHTKYLIKKVEFKGTQRTKTFLSNRSKPIVPFNWRKYRYYIIDGLTPEYGITPCWIDERLVNVVFDTTSNNPVSLWYDGTIIWAEETIDEDLSKRIFKVFEPESFTPTQGIFKDREGDFISRLDVDTILAFKTAVYQINLYSRAIYNILPIARRQKVDAQRAVKRLLKLTSIPFSKVGTGLTPISKNLESMYNDILLP